MFRVLSPRCLKRSLSGLGRFCVHGPRHADVVEELVRREAERCDRLAGFMAMMSVAGGTGSGVGTYVTQRLRDVHPKSFILNHLVWPYGTGEVLSTLLLFHHFTRNLYC